MGPSLGRGRCAAPSRWTERPTSCARRRRATNRARWSSSMDLRGPPCWRCGPLPSAPTNRSRPPHRRRCRGSWHVPRAPTAQKTMVCRGRGRCRRSPTRRHRLWWMPCPPSRVVAPRSRGPRLRSSRRWSRGTQSARCFPAWSYPRRLKVSEARSDLSAAPVDPDNTLADRVRSGCIGACVVRGQFLRSCWRGRRSRRPWRSVRSIVTTADAAQL